MLRDEARRRWEGLTGKGDEVEVMGVGGRGGRQRLMTWRNILAMCSRVHTHTHPRIHARAHAKIVAAAKGRRRRKSASASWSHRSVIRDPARPSFRPPRPERQNDSRVALLSSREGVAPAARRPSARADNPLPMTAAALAPARRRNWQSIALPTHL